MDVRTGLSCPCRWTFVLPGNVEVLRPITGLTPAWERVVVVCCVQLSSRLEARWLRRLAVLKLTVNHHQGSRLSVLQLFENADTMARAERALGRLSCVCIDGSAWSGTTQDASSGVSLERITSVSQRPCLFLVSTESSISLRGQYQP